MNINNVAQNGASVLLIEPAGKVLLVLRSDGGGWEPVTGGIEPGETPKQAALREVFEEVGLILEEKNLVFGAEFLLQNGTSVDTFIYFVDDIEWLNIKIDKKEASDFSFFSYLEVCALRNAEENGANPKVIGYGAFHRTALLLKSDAKFFLRYNPKVQTESTKDLNLSDSFTCPITGRIYKPV